MAQQESSVTVELPDGSTLDVPSGTTVEGVAYEIGPGLGDDTVAGKLDGELVAKEEPVYDGAAIEIVTPSADEYHEVLRHSAAHVFAQALQRTFPEAKLTIGPWTDEGFYYDVTGVDLDEGDLETIEEEAESIIEEDLPIERVLVDREEALDRYDDNRYKREILDEEAAGVDPVSFYEQGEFADLCQGPHVESTGEIGGFALLEMSASYWRGDEDDDTLTRVYGTAFPSEDELEEFLDRREAAKERDHRKIGREMDLFSVPEHSPGCAHYHPNGMTIRRELEEYVREKNDELGYDEVWTPELNKKELWEESGHLDFFGSEGEFFLWEQNDEEYGLKPMNCANHAYIYDDRTRSYRDLPVKFSEFGTVYRNEQSGELSGLFRVRGLTQDDGHAFVRPDQIEDEIVHTLSIIEDMYSQFGLEVIYKLETKGEHSVGGDEIWEQATDALTNALEGEGLDYDVEEGEAAFYGPKIGLDARDALGREWTIGTVQVDFNIPERLDLTYVGEDNEEHRPVMIHRALLGSFERFMGVMIEHFNGRFPLWLAPEQVRVLPVNEDAHDYAHGLADDLSADGFRASVADGDDTLQRKIRAAHDDNLPYMLIVGPDERDAGTVSVRDRSEREERGVDPEDFRAHLRDERDEMRVEPDFLDE